MLDEMYRATLVYTLVLEKGKGERERGWGGVGWGGVESEGQKERRIDKRVQRDRASQKKERS